MADRAPLELHRDGNARGRTLFFVHGWPDDHRVWEPQIEAFVGRHHCVRVTLPGYGDEDDAPRGFDFPELVDRLVASIEAVCEERGEEQVVLVGHDWGAYLAYLVEQRCPQRIERLVTLDVGGHMRPTRLRDAALIAAYQLPLVATWLARRALPRVANRVSHTVASRVGAPLHHRARPVDARASYPYFYLWRGLTVPAYRDRLLRRCEPRCPTLYLYGKRKPVMFHSPRWLAMLEQRPDCAVVALDSDHWLTLSRPAEVNAAIARFVETA
jgi:pimeloyl-ACP methyl ester carboxylesterase